MEFVLHALGEEDSLNIRRHYRYYRNLITVRISLGDHLTGMARFRSVCPWGYPGNRGNRYSNMNAVHDQGIWMSIADRSIEWVTDTKLLLNTGEPALSLLAYSGFEEIATRIFRDAMYASGDCTIDVDERTIYGLDTTLLRIHPSYFPAVPDILYALPRTGCYVIIAALYHPSQAVNHNRDDVAWQGAEYLCNVKLHKGHAAWIARQAVYDERAKMVIRIRDQAAQDVRVDLRHLELLLIEGEMFIGNDSEFVIQLERTTADGIITVSQASISVLTLRRHWFMHLTWILDKTPQYINPEMTATHVDCHWNFIRGNGRPSLRPPSEEVWREFVENVTLSPYFRVERRLRRRHKFWCPKTRVMTYWFCLKDILCETRTRTPEDMLSVTNLFKDFPKIEWS